jgi:hypothetical protein
MPEVLAHAWRRSRCISARGLLRIAGVDGWHSRARRGPMRTKTPRVWANCPDIGLRRDLACSLEPKECLGWICSHCGKMRTYPDGIRVCAH